MEARCLREHQSPDHLKYVFCDATEVTVEHGELLRLQCLAEEVYALRASIGWTTPATTMDTRLLNTLFSICQCDTVVINEGKE